MATKKGKSKRGAKPAKPKALQMAESRVSSLQRDMKRIQAKVDELKKKTGDRTESSAARAARAEAMKELEPLQQQLEQKGQALERAVQSHATLAGNYSKMLSKAGFTKAAERFQTKAQTLGKSAGEIAGKNFINQYTAGGSTGEKIGGIATGGVAGITDAVNKGLNSVTETGKGIVGMNLGEANTALFGGNGQPGIIGMTNEIATGQQDANTAAQQQLFQGFRNLAPDFRAGMEAISPEMVRAGNLANRDVNRTNRLEKGTYQDTRQSLNQQQRLAAQAARQAANYQDPTKKQVRRAGRQMFNSAAQVGGLANQATSQAMDYVDPTRASTLRLGNEMAAAARQTGGLANQATSQAMNYVDPTAALAQGAISGFQGLTGLQQKAAEDAYARSGQLSAQQNRDAQQAAREAFAARGMTGSTGSVAAEVLNREASLANRRAEAAQLGQIAQQGQTGLVGLASGYESDALGRRTGLQQNAASLQGAAGSQMSMAGQFQSGMESDYLNRRTGLQQNAANLQGTSSAMYGNAGQFVTSAESEARRRQMAMQQNAMGLSQGAQQGQMMTRAEADQARQNLANIGKSYLDYGLPLMTNRTAAQQYAGGFMGLGLGMSGQGSGLLQTGTNLGLAQNAQNLEYWNAKQAADAAKDAGKMGLISAGIKTVGNLAGKALFPTG